MKEKFKNKMNKFKKELRGLKDKISKTTIKKLFCCEAIIIVSFFMFIVTNFLLNFYLGMYLLSLSLFLIALFTWKHL